MPLLIRHDHCGGSSSSSPLDPAPPIGRGDASPPPHPAPLACCPMMLHKLHGCAWIDARASRNVDPLLVCGHSSPGWGAVHNVLDGERRRQTRPHHGDRIMGTPPRRAVARRAADPRSAVLNDPVRHWQRWLRHRGPRPHHEPERVMVMDITVPVVAARPPRPEEARHRTPCTIGDDRPHGEGWRGPASDDLGGKC